MTNFDNFTILQKNLNLTNFDQFGSILTHVVLIYNFLGDLRVPEKGGISRFGDNDIVNEDV